MPAAETNSAPDQPPIGRWSRRLLRGPGWLFFAAAGLAAIWIVYRSSEMDVIRTMAFAIRSGRIMLAVWGLWLLIALIASWRSRQAGVWREWRWWRWLLAPLVALALTRLWATDIPMHVRFALARPALDRFAQQMLQPGTTPPPSARVAGYRIEAIVADPNGVRFLVHNAEGFFTSYGFWYRPQCDQDEYGYARGAPIGGDWYECERYWGPE